MLSTNKTTKLSKMCFGLQTDPNKTPFGFLNGQVRHDAIITSAGWYNFEGQKLGYGDLSLQDMAKISSTLSKNEIFLVLSEGDSFWNVPKNINSAEPGSEYVIANASWVISNSLIVRSRSDIKKSEKTSKDGISYVRIPRSNVKDVLTPSQPIKEKSDISLIDEGILVPVPILPPKKKKTILKPRAVGASTIAGIVPITP
jgi:hypothetical protein